MRGVFYLSAGVVLAWLAGCAPVTPGTILTQPTSMRPQPTLAGPVALGSIYQASGYRPLFEDQRPRVVGDILTVVISEKASADKKNTASSNRSASAITNPQTIFGASMSAFAINANGSSNSSVKEDGTAASTFTTTLTVTVVDVLSNGNLVVSGEKQIGFDQGSEFIRFSGVVPPAVIKSNNTVPSTQVADARLEYRTNTHIDKSQLAGMLNRFFYSVLPL